MKSAARAHPPLEKSREAHHPAGLDARVSGASEQIHFAQLINPHTHTQLPPALSAVGIKTRAHVCNRKVSHPSTHKNILTILI
jgi:hypothetical protein